MALAEHYMMSGDWANNNVKAGLANQNEITGKYVKSARVKDNVIIIMYGNDANKAIANSKVYFTAKFDLANVRWECASAGVIKDRHLPSACR